MRRRFLAALLVTGLLAAALVWLIRHTEWTTETTSTPASGDARTDPFYAAERLVRTLGADSTLLSGLGRMPPAGDVLVVTNWQWNLDDRSRSDIEHWVQEGGRLVLDDSTGGLAELQRWTGLELLYPFAGGRDPSGSDARCRDMSPIGAESRTRRTPSLSICGLTSIRRLLLRSGPEWGVGDVHGAQALRIVVGRGRVFYVDGTPFVGRTLIDHDDALLFTTGSQLHHGDHVHFLTTRAARPLLGILWQNAAATIALLGGALALLVVRWGTRFGPVMPANDSARRSLRDQIRGTARFLRRAGEGDLLHAATREALEAEALRRLVGYGQLPVRERVQLLARSAHQDPELLAAALAGAKLRGLSDLTESLLVLEATRRRLLLQRIP